jgi:hypothetical protein
MSMTKPTSEQVTHMPIGVGATQTTVQQSLRDADDGVTSLRGALPMQKGGVIAFMFDDGYASNYTYALPIFKKYGMAATIAVEVDKVGANYNGNPAYPVCNPDQLRELVRNGWEVTNHPALVLTDTEAVMVSKAQAENTLLVQYLTGEKLAPNAQPGSLTYPEFVGYPVETAVYRGGARNATSDLAYRYVFDKVRSINGSEAASGNHLYVFGSGAERTTQMSALIADTTNTSLSSVLAFVKGVAQTRSTAILYAHDTPQSVPSSPIAPYILASELDQLLSACHELGVAVVPIRNLYQGNAVRDSRFELSTGTFGARPGDSSAFITTDTLNGGSRAVQLVSSASVSNLNTRYVTQQIVCEPFSRYRVRVRYKIDTDLDIGGVENFNSGMVIFLNTLEGNTIGTQSYGFSNETVARFDANPTGPKRVPYQATSGWAETAPILITGNGALANITISLFGCIGTVKIGQIIVERLGNLNDIGLSGTNTFNASGGRAIPLGTGNDSAQRDWEWKVDVYAPPIQSSATYNFAANNPAMFSPTTGTTCFVLPTASGAFAGQEGKLATYSGSAWSFSNIAAGTMFLVSNYNGTANLYVRLLEVSTGYGDPVFIVTRSQRIDDPAFYNTANSSVYSTSGLRTDTFTWYARPVASGRN